MSLPRVKRGQAITSDLFNSVIDELNKNSVISIVGGKLNKSINGTTIAVQVQPPTTERKLPFTFSTSVCDGIVYGNLSYGTLNNIVPYNIYNSLTIGSSPVTASERRFVTLDCISDGVSVTTVGWSITATTPAPTVPALFAAPVTLSPVLHILDGTASTRVIGSGSLSARVCESIRIFKPSFGVNELSFDVYYTWVMASIDDFGFFYN
jgi:hypothetical protein